MGRDRVFIKINRVLCNDEWYEEYFEVLVEFLFEGIFDYFLVIVIM